MNKKLFFKRHGTALTDLWDSVPLNDENDQAFEKFYSQDELEMFGAICQSESTRNNDVMTIIDAQEFASEKHKGQKDDDGHSYLWHLFQVFDILRQVTNDTDILVAGILHDTLEDTDTTYDELKEKFGERVADLVNEMTDEQSDDKWKGHWFPRLHSKDAIMIKFADRLSNMSRMDSWSEDRQNHYLRRSRFWKKSGDDKVN